MQYENLLFVVVVFFVLQDAYSQESQSKIGVGISLNPTALFASDDNSTLFLPVGLTNIYFPIMVSSSFRIEPEAGIYSQSSESSSGGYTASSNHLSAEARNRTVLRKLRGK